MIEISDMYMVKTGNMFYNIFFEEYSVVYFKNIKKKHYEQ